MSQPSKLGGLGVPGERTYCLLQKKKKKCGLYYDLEYMLGYMPCVRFQLKNVEVFRAEYP